MERTGRQYGIPIPWDVPIIEDVNAPQQNRTSVDCGVAVLYIIKRYYEQESIIKELAETELTAMRTDIVETFLNWAKGQP